MITACKCENKDCAKSTECQRFTNSMGEVMNFKSICKQDNGHEWLYKVDSTTLETK